MNNLTTFPTCILAGGKSERMGFPKAKLSKNGIPILRAMVEALIEAGYYPVGVVIGEKALEKWVAQEVPDVDRIFNQTPELGAISSLRLAIKAMENSASGLLSWPVDHPLIAVETLKQMKLLATATNIVIPTFDGRRGHPTWWGRGSWEMLMSEAANNGANRILKLLENIVIEVPVNDPGVLVNIDTPEVAARHGLAEGV